MYNVESWGQFWSRILYILVLKTAKSKLSLVSGGVSILISFL